MRERQQARGVGLASALTYWHTIRYLKPVQFWSRALFRVGRPQSRLVRADAAPLPRNWQNPVAKPVTMTGPTRFQFLNVSQDLNTVGWDDPEVEKLWRYNLHYFDDLGVRGSPERHQWHEEIILRWMAENPAAAGTGWEPYPVSLRIVNWIKWLLAGNLPPPGMIGSLASQADWLTRRLEYHLLGNHLFANGKALVFAGLFLSGPDAERWLAIGTGILRSQLKEQILEDGGHFELSPMYHAIALDDVLDLINIMTAYGHDAAALGLPISKELVVRMLEWLAAMTHPDGEISLFNDAAFGIAPRLGDLSAYAARLDIPIPARPRDGLTHLAASGYIRLQANDAVCIIDVAAIGPDYLPGHAHADTLSFELSVHGKRLVVNSGTSLYGNGPERLRQRGTAAHNTVLIDGENSSEVWSGFRVARRARPQGPSVSRAGDKWTISCAHDGYRRLSRPVTHTRQWTFDDRTLSIVDSFGDAKATAEARFHFSPEVTITAITDRQFVADLPESTVKIDIRQGEQAHLETASWHPRFGDSVANQRLSVHSFGAPIGIKIEW